MKTLSLLFFCQLTLFGEPFLREVAFEHVVDVGFGNEVCVVGNHPHLGDGDSLLAPKLTYSAGNIWKANIALPAGESFSYRFIQKSNQVTDWCDPGSYQDLTAPLTVVVPAGPAAPWAGKTILYRSLWSEVDVLVHDQDDGIPDNWQVWPMERVAAGEHRIDLAVPPGHRIEFVFKNRRAEEYDNAPAPPNHDASGTAAPWTPVPYQSLTPPYNYETDLDVFLVQEGEVFTRRPPLTVTAPRIEVVPIASTAASISSRNIRVYLPRGYDQSATRRYPVLIMHDGQNCYFPGGTFGTWDVDRIATFETSQGRMRETIICAVDNSSNRLSEYLPNGDVMSGNGGNAPAYGDFLKNDVLPHLQANYRLYLNSDGDIDPAQMAMAGSSLGGLVSGYLGQEILFERGEPLFGTLGIFSASYWAAPNHVARRDTLPRLNQKTFFYMGTAESSGGPAASQSFWNDTLQAYDHFNGLGHSIGRGIAFAWGCGTGHNEPAWSQQMPKFLQFSFGAAAAPNLLAAELYPPTLCFDGQSLDFIALRGIPYLLKESGNLVDWSAGTEFQEWAQPWETCSKTVIPNTAKQYYRVEAAP